MLLLEKPSERLRDIRNISSYSSWYFPKVTQLDFFMQGLNLGRTDNNRLRSYEALTFGRPVIQG